MIEYEKLNGYDVRVNNLKEAINLASQWKEEKRFDWFRGQKELWPLKSTLSRQIENKNYDASEEIITHLIHWFQDYKTYQYMSFKNFTDLFVKHVIPYQAISKDKYCNFIFYNPTEIYVFGLA